MADKLISCKDVTTALRKRWHETKRNKLTGEAETLLKGGMPEILKEIEDLPGWEEQREKK